jgi:hypothetical protein
MNPIFPIIELVDRYAIAKLKFFKTQANTSEVEFYTAQLSSYDLSTIQDELAELYDIHSMIWELEALLKSGCEQQLPLEEIGRRAILIRDYNNKRVAIKNSIATKLGCHVREFKKNHLSE